MAHVKDHPFAVGTALAVGGGEYWAINLMPVDPTVSDWIFTLLGGPFFIVVTMFPAALFVVLFWALLGWWD